MQSPLRVDGVHVAYCIPFCASMSAGLLLASLDPRLLLIATDGRYPKATAESIDSYRASQQKPYKRMHSFVEQYLVPQGNLIPREAVQRAIVIP
jgi:hypothetical protein